CACASSTSARCRSSRHPPASRCRSDAASTTRSNSRPIALSEPERNECGSPRPRSGPGARARCTTWGGTRGPAWGARPEGARMVAEAGPARAEEMLAEVERMGAQAVEELESLVGITHPRRDDPEGPSTAGGPDVRVLVDRLRRTGQIIDLIEEGDAVALDE